MFPRVGGWVYLLVFGTLDFWQGEPSFSPPAPLRQRHDHCPDAIDRLTHLDTESYVCHTSRTAEEVRFNCLE